MAGSTLSLDSLSSPSPSPSPQPETSKPTEPTSAGLDSDSELSELTEEEQEKDKRNSSPRKRRTGTARRGVPPPRRGGRRKTSSIVPAPMWGWAETKSSSNVVEEEEEEEMAGPPKAMEEEEDEEAGHADEEEEEIDVQPGHSISVADAEEDDPPEEEDPIVVNGAEDDDDFVSGDEDPEYRNSRPRRSTRRSVGTLSVPAESTTSDDETSKSTAIVNGHHDNDDIDVEADEDDEGSDGELPSVHADDPESENESESEDEEADAKEDDTAEPTKENTPVASSNPSTEAITSLMDADVDVTAPPPQDIAPLAAAAAASSIMAGSGIIDDPPSPSSSQASSASGSRASSRSASPAPVSDREGSLPAVKLNDDGPTSPAHDTISAPPTREVEPPEAGDDHDPEADEIEVDDAAQEDDADMEVESDLQPAHRAEALDVLATIELKFALLRERVYVEKMEGLAWEEQLVNDSTHPELLHLHRELSSRRDKRLELASRRRSYEIAHVTKRRRMDEDATWSWWKVARDDLQTEMISETNRKRRRMERERRAIERPQPIRRIPTLPHDLPPAPSLRKIIKSFPFESTRRQSKHRHHHPQAQKLVYPELTTLSAVDVSNDLEFLMQARMERERGRGPLGYDMHIPRGMSANMGVNPPHPGGMGMGLPPAPHPLGYDGYNDGIGMGGPGPFGVTANVSHRVQPPPPFQQHPHQHQHHALPPPPPPQQGGPIMSTLNAPFAGPPGSRNVHMHSQQPPQSIHTHNHPPPPHHHGHGVSQFAADQGQDIGGGPPGQSLTHTYFGAPLGQHLGSRRSPSPVGALPNGTGGKMNGSWMGAGMGMERVYTGSGKGGEWGGRDARMGAEEEEREKIVREREKREREYDLREHDHARDQRERGERERDRDPRERDRDREPQDVERDRQHIHQQQLQQQMQHRHAAPHLHIHPYPVNASHHHHRPHHHHVVHHHHTPQPGTSGHGSSSLPPPGSLRSPRSSQQREYENNGRPQGHNQHPTEIINLTSAKSASSSAHSHWKGEDQHLPPPDYRDGRSKHAAGPARPPPPSGPGGPVSMMDDRDRPMPIPFVMSSTHNTPSNMSPPLHAPPPSNPSHINGHSSPRGAWNPPEDSFRIPPPSSLASSSAGPPPPGYIGSSTHDGGVYIRSPNHRFANATGGGSSLGRGPPPSSSQQSSRQNSLGLHSPPRATVSRPAMPPSSPSASASTPYSSSHRSPTRFGPPPPPLPPPQQHPPPLSSTNGAISSVPLNRSPPVSLKMHPSSPLASKMLSGPLPPPPPPSSSASVYSPRLTGPGRTSTPTGTPLPDGVKNGICAGGATGYPGPGSSRTASPLMAFPSPASHPGLAASMGPRSSLGSPSVPMANGTGAGGVGDHDRDWERLERQKERDRLVSPQFGPPPPPPPPPSKMSLPQMVDGH